MVLNIKKIHILKNFLNLEIVKLFKICQEIMDNIVD